MTFYQKNYCLLSFLFHIGHDLYLLGYDALIFFFFFFYTPLLQIKNLQVRFMKLLDALMADLEP